MPLHINSDEQVGEANLPPLRRHAYAHFPLAWGPGPGLPIPEEEGGIFLSISALDSL